VAVNKAKGCNPALKVAGVTAFTFEELSRATNSFDEKNQIGQGGYGKVYVGDLKDGRQRVAIKRAEPGSLQGANEFYTEIELLSRVHHRNLCGLVGYCDDLGEQVASPFLSKYYCSFKCFPVLCKFVEVLFGEKRIIDTNVMLVGQMLVYEFMPGGTLRDHLSRKRSVHHRFTRSPWEFTVRVISG
jgi:serine/threonine protein kinase